MTGKYLIRGDFREAMGYHAHEVEATDSEGGARVDSTNDRRRGRRSLFVEVQVHDRDELYVHKARNVSAGGMFLDAPLPLPPGTRLGLRFGLPGLGSVECAAEVRWNTEMAVDGGSPPSPGMGVVFEDISEAVRGLLERFVESVA